MFLNLLDGMAFQFSGMLLYFGFSSAILIRSLLLSTGVSRNSRPELFFCSGVSVKVFVSTAVRSDDISLLIFRQSAPVRFYGNSVKCKTRFPATLIYRADCLFQATKAVFVVGTDDFSKNMGEVLEQFHRPAAQYPTLFCPHDLDL